MPLIDCPDCGREISDAAPRCIHCGRPDPAHGSGPPPDGDPDEPVFHPLDVRKLAVMSLCTLGLYEIYWFYRNWKGLKERVGKSLIAWLRALFAPVTAYWLFREVPEIVRPRRIGWSAGSVAILYLALSASWQLPDPWWLMSLGSFAALIPVQRTINDAAARDLSPDVIDNRYSGLHVAVIIVGGLFLVLAVIGTFLPPPGPEERLPATVTALRAALF